MKKIITAVAILVAATGAANATVYELNPGSNLTLLSTGATYELTGSFEWGPLDPPEAGFATFTESALNFTGGPVSIFLRSEPQTQGSITFAEDEPGRCSGVVCKAFFGASVDLMVEGLGALYDYGFASLGSGDYIGDYKSPTGLIYTNVFVAPNEGGRSIAKLNFSATAVSVPEPSTLSLLLIAALSVGFLHMLGTRYEKSRNFRT